MWMSTGRSSHATLIAMHAPRDEASIKSGTATPGQPSPSTPVEFVTSGALPAVPAAPAPLELPPTPASVSGPNPIVVTDLPPHAVHATSEADINALAKRLTNTALTRTR